MIVVTEIEDKPEGLQVAIVMVYPLEVRLLCVSGGEAVFTVSLPFKTVSVRLNCSDLVEVFSVFSLHVVLMSGNTFNNKKDSKTFLHVMLKMKRRG